MIQCTCNARRHALPSRCAVVCLLRSERVEHKCAAKNRERGAATHRYSTRAAHYVVVFRHPSDDPPADGRWRVRLPHRPGCRPAMVTIMALVEAVPTIPRSVAHCVSLQCTWVVDRGWSECVLSRAHWGHPLTLHRPFRRCSVLWCTRSLLRAQDAERGVARMCSAKSTGWSRWGTTLSVWTLYRVPVHCMTSWCTLGGRDRWAKMCSMMSTMWSPSRQECCVVRLVVHWCVISCYNAHWVVDDRWPTWTRR